MSIQNINALDRVPTEVLENGAVRYEEFDADGNSLGYKYIKRADNPVEAGTNINKVLFDLIDSNTNEEQGERSRVDRYNVPTLEHDIGAIAGDIIPKSWDAITNYYKYSKNGITLECKALYGSSSSNAVTKVCDGYDSNYVSHSLHNSNPDYYNTYFLWEFATPTKISKMKLKITFENTVSKIKGSIDGNTWIDLYTLSSLSSLTEITLSNTDFYKYYKVECELDLNYNNKSVTFYEWKVSEYYGNISNILSLDLNVNSYFDNQRVLIETPNALDITKSNYININNLGEKLINGELEVNKKYELIYNGECFDAILRSDTINNNLSIKTGTISDGAVIPQTSGYGNYIYMVSINSGEAFQYASNGARYGGVGINCSVNQDTRVVVAKVGVLASYSDSNIVYASATATYTEIAWN